MSKQKIFTFSAIVFLCLLDSMFCFAQTDAYTFYTAEKDVYRLENPFEDSDNVWVVHQAGVYKPYYVESENKFIVIGFEDAVFQLQQMEDATSLAPLKLWDSNALREKKIYRHSILENPWPDNWLTALMRKDNRFRDTIYIGSLSDKGTPSIELKLLNFYISRPNRFSIRLNDQSIDTVLQTFGGYSMQLDFQKSEENPKHLIFEIEPLNGDLGVAGYKLNVNVDQIDYDQSFYCYSSIEDLQLGNIDDQHFYHFYLDGYEMKRLTQKNPPANRPVSLLVKQKSDMQDCLVQKAAFAKISEKPIDILLVYHQRFESAMDSLVALYKFLRPDASIQTVGTQEIYNTYSSGTKSPQAIRTHLWKVQPKEVCLVGDANANEQSEQDLVPTFYFKQMMKYTRVPSDFLYALSSDSSRIGFSIGRLPFDNEETLLQYVRKVERFIALPPSPHKLMLYDDSEYPLDIGIVRQHANFLYKRPNPKIARFEKNIVQWSNRYDCHNVAYHGHGAFSSWRENDRVDIRKYEELEVDRLFLLFDFSCLTGEFSFPFRKSFSEELLSKPNGPVAIVGSSGFVEGTIYKQLVSFLLESPEQRIGHFVNRFKSGMPDKLSGDDFKIIQILGIPSLVYSGGPLLDKSTQN
ncbi:MAG: C25 family cysteine peptidase [Bacteroidota bacterium]